MAFQNMTQELLGVIPGLNLGLAKTRINESLRKIQDENMWSFQCKFGGFLTPGLLGGSYSGQGQSQSFNAGATFLSPGTITVTPFTDQITGDAVATAAWNGITSPPLITQQQIRVPYYAIYSVIAQGNNGTVAYATIATGGSGQTPGTYTVPVLDGGSGSGGTVSITVNASGVVTAAPIVVSVGSNYTMPYITFSEGGTPATFAVQLIAVLTIDRLWTDPPQLNSGYMLYQVYFAFPPGYKRTFTFVDLVNNNSMDWFSKTQIDLSIEDPERTVFDDPLYIVPIGPDNRPGSSTFGQQLFEMWPGPLSSLSYSFMAQCNIPPLVNPNDTVPYPLNDELVKHRALELLSIWKEGQKGDNMERGSGANWQFLTKAYHEEYKDLLRQARIMDRHLIELYFTKAQQTPAFGWQDGYATVNSQLNVGVF